VSPADLRRGRRRDEDREGPTIRVARLSGATDAALRELLAGLEEEGVPATVVAGVESAAAPPPETAEALAAAAHAAARASTLRVGVALDAEHACVTVPRLPDARPLLRGDATDPIALRCLGQDAARLVKTVPLTDHPTNRSPR
jgi:anti-sigma factor RsiW